MAVLTNFNFNAQTRQIVLTFDIPFTLTNSLLASGVNLIPTNISSDETFSLNGSTIETTGGTDTTITMSIALWSKITANSSSWFTSQSSTYISINNPGIDPVPVIRQVDVYTSQTDTAVLSNYSWYAGETANWHIEIDSTLYATPTSTITVGNGTTTAGLQLNTHYVAWCVPLTTTSTPKIRIRLTPAGYALATALTGFGMTPSTTRVTSGSVRIWRNITVSLSTTSMQINNFASPPGYQLTQPPVFQLQGGVDTQVLGTDGNGNLYWGSGGGSGGVTQLIAGSNIQLNPAGGTGAVTITATGSGLGSVTDVSVVSTNGFSGTVNLPSTTPQISIGTTVTGLLKGDGSGISDATAGVDFQAPLTTSTSVSVAQISGTQLTLRSSTNPVIIRPATLSSSTTYTLPPSGPTANGQVLAGSVAGQLSWSSVGSGSVTNFSFTNANGFIGTVNDPTVDPVLSLGTSVNGVIKGLGGALVVAVAGTDYQAPITPSTGLTASTISGTLLTLRGSTSGNIQFLPGATPTNQVYTLPTAYPASTGQVLSSDLMGNLTWISTAGAGTVTSVTAGTGLSGGTITGAGTIALIPPTGGNIGGVKAGNNITIDSDGTINATGGGSGGVTQIIAGSNILISPVGGTGAVTINATGGGGGGGGGSASQYTGSINTVNAIATTAEINAALPVGVTVNPGDLFIDTSSRSNNLQPLYIYAGFNWRQLLTALGV